MFLPYIFTTPHNEQIIIDRATLHDCAGVADVKKSAILDSYAAHLDVSGMLPTEVPEKYHWLLHDPFTKELAFHVARDDHATVVGFVVAMQKIADAQLAWRVAWAQKDLAAFQKLLSQADDSIIWIDQLFIMNAWRGKGIGKKLLQSVVHRFPNAKKMQLFVCEFNTTAIAFYERVGFKRIETSIAKDGQGNDRIDLHGKPVYHSLMEIAIHQLEDKNKKGA